jgi:hypothetical protein
VGDLVRSDRTSLEERIRLLTETYRAILERYHEIERRSMEERELLQSRERISDVIAVMKAKREILREIRAREEQVAGAREWWKRSRRTLPDASCRELVPLLDAISRKIERILALESECRQRLDRLIAWGASAPELEVPVPAARATMAYERAIANSRRGRTP